MEKKLSWATKIGYGTGTIGKGLSYALASTFLSVYFLNVLHIDAGYLAVLFFLAKIWDGINDILMGTIIDNTKSRFGKFRPWIVAGAVTNAIVTTLMFYYPGFDGIGLYIYVTVLYVLWDMTYTMIDVGYWAMIPAMTLDSKERDQVSLIPRVFGSVAGLTGAFMPQIIDLLGGMELNAGFLKLSLITSVAYIVTAGICVFFAKERVTNTAEQKQEPFSLGRSLKILFRNDQALVIVGIMILFNMAINLTNGVSLFYFLYVLENNNMYSFFTILLGISQGVGLLGFPFFCKWFGRHRVYVASLVIPCIGYTLMILSNTFLNGQFLPFAMAAFVMSSGFGSMSVMQNVMLADAVDYGEWREKTRNEGVIFSMLTFLSKIATAFSQFIIMFGFKIVKFGGENATTATPEAVRAIEFIMFWLPPVVLVCALLIYLKGFKLKPEFMEQISDEIRKRHETAVTSDSEI